jgi:hypothetical protein
MLKKIIHSVLVACGVFFLCGLVEHFAPSVQHTAFTIGAFSVSYLMCFLLTLAALAFWVSGKKGRR